MESRTLIIGIKGHLVAIEAATGREIWRRKLRSSTMTSVRHVGDRVYVGTRGELLCVGASTGSIVWENPLKGLGFGAILFGDTVADDPDVVFTIRNRVVSLHSSTGSENWRTKLGVGGTGIVRVVSPDRIVAASMGKLWGLDRRTGSIEWSNTLSGLGHGMISMGLTDPEAVAIYVAKARASHSEAG